MKHRIATMTFCLCAAAAFAVTAGTVARAQQYQMPMTKEVTLTGCVVQGSGPSVFLLENAKADPRDTEEKGRSYRLASLASSISFREHLNHEVQIEGSAETKELPIPAMGEKVKESELPRLTAMKITQVATTCSAPNM